MLEDEKEDRTTISNDVRERSRPTAARYNRLAAMTTESEEGRITCHV